MSTVQRLRSDGDDHITKIEETLRTAGAADVRLQVSHLLPRSGKAIGERCVEAVEAARAAGLDVALDMHTRLYRPMSWRC